ncbi:MAG: small multi-drug export protein [archaeon]
MSNNLLIAAIISMLPIAEVRGGIPYALSTINLTITNIILVYSLCVLANALVAIPIWIFMDLFHSKLCKIKIYNNLSKKVIDKIRIKSHKLEPQINRYGYIALAVFVGIPLPMTGAWTGSIAAWILDLNRKKSFMAIFLGVAAAGIIMTLSFLGLLRLFRF